MRPKGTRYNPWMHDGDVSEYYRVHDETLRMLRGESEYHNEVLDVPMINAYRRIIDSGNSTG
jgi:hypothetical protein